MLIEDTTIESKFPFTRFLLKEYENIIDADRATWEDRKLALPSRYMVTIGEIEDYAKIFNP